jgi:hypothetical protein
MPSFAHLLPTSAMPSLSCRRPFIRTLSERLMRSVQIGCSRYSRRSHLLVALSFRRVMERGPAQGCQCNPQLRTQRVTHGRFETP